MAVTLEELLQTAKEMNASDLHIAAGLPPKGRVNGQLTDMGEEKLTSKDMVQLLAPMVSGRYKSMLQERGEAELSCSFPEQGRCRATIFRQRSSYAAAIRLINDTILTPEQLGLPSSVVELTKKKSGIVLAAGPAGSGKTTTLAALIDVINTNYSAHIITLENPLEYLHDHKKSIINQRQIGLDTRSYAHALKAALRADADVILVGEMHDMDTVSMAVTAAETGHLVFSTMQTMGAAQTVERMVDLFPPHQQQQMRVRLASVLEAVVSQQLIPTADRRGRAAAYEVMHATAAVKNLIREGKSHQISAVIQSSRKAGMQDMDDAIYELYLNRRIDAEMALSYAWDPLDLERKLF